MYSSIAAVDFQKVQKVKQIHRNVLADDFSLS